MRRGINRLRRRAVVADADPVTGGTSDGNDNFRQCSALGLRFLDPKFNDSEFMMVVVDGEVHVADTDVVVQIVAAQDAQSDELVLRLELIPPPGNQILTTWAPITFGSTFLLSKWTPPLPTQVKIVSHHLGKVCLPISEVVPLA